METTRARRGPLGIATLLIVSIAVSGCRTVVRMNPEELYKLDGFRYGDTAFLSFHESKSLPFTSNVPLTIVHTSGRGFTRRYVYIEVDDVYFRGKTSAARSSGSLWMRSGSFGSHAAARGRPSVSSGR